MLIIWQCCNIHKISASQLRNSHNTTMGQIFLCTYLNIYAGVPVATGDSTFCRYTWIRTLIHEWNSKITVSAKSSCQQEQVLFSQYLSQVKKVLWTQLYFVYFERVWEHTKKKASTAVLLQRPADTQTSHVVSEERETPSESSGTTSGLNCVLKTSGSFLCVQEESLLKHSWCL